MFSYFGIIGKYVSILRFQKFSKNPQTYLFTKKGGRNRSIWGHHFSKSIHKKVNSSSKICLSYQDFAYVFILRDSQKNQFSIFPKFPRVHHSNSFSQEYPEKRRLFWTQEKIPKLTPFQNSKKMSFYVLIQILDINKKHSCF